MARKSGEEVGGVQVGDGTLVLAAVELLCRRVNIGASFRSLGGMYLVVPDELDPFLWTRREDGPGVEASAPVDVADALRVSGCSGSRGVIFGTEGRSGKGQDDYDC